MRLQLLEVRVDTAACILSGEIKTCRKKRKCVCNSSHEGASGEPCSTGVSGLRAVFVAAAPDGKSQTKVHRIYKGSPVEVNIVINAESYVCPAKAGRMNGFCR